MFGEDAMFDPVRADMEDFLRDNPNAEVDEDGAEIDLPDDEVDLPFDEGLPPFHGDETPMGEVLEGE